jgi:hypothetical protein
MESVTLMSLSTEPVQLLGFHIGSKKEHKTVFIRITNNIRLHTLEQILSAVCDYVNIETGEERWPTSITSLWRPVKLKPEHIHVWTMWPDDVDTQLKSAFHPIPKTRVVDSFFTGPQRYAEYATTINPPCTMD